MAINSGCIYNCNINGTICEVRVVGVDSDPTVAVHVITLADPDTLIRVERSAFIA